MTRIRTAGFTLGELLIGIAVLGIGILAAVLIMGNSLRISANAEQNNGVVDVVREEIEYQVQRSIPEDIDVTNGPCGTTSDSGCTVTIQGCKVVTGVFTCASGTVGSVAYKVTVSHTGPRGDTFTLETVSTGFYINGASE